MADLLLNILGNGDGAAKAMKDVAHEASGLQQVLDGALKGALGSTVTTFSTLETVAEKAAEVIKDFAKESIEEFAKAERIQLQLKTAAGEYTEALNELAEAQKRKYAVDDDSIRQMQVLLLRYGAAPGQIEAATDAILNYAAVTGKDALGATEQLIRGVESGTGSLGRMGVHFQETGHFAGDLANAVQALGEKFAGGAAADAETLDGRMRRVEQATNDVKKAFGAMFSEVESRHGILKTLAMALDGVNESLQKGQFLRTLFGAPSEDEERRKMLEHFHPGIFVDAPPAFQTKSYDSNKLPMTGAGDHAVGSGDKGKKARDAFEAYLNEQNKYYDRKWLADRENERLELEHDETIAKSKKALADYEEEVRADALKAAEQSEKEMSKALLDSMKQEQDDIAALNEITISRLNAQKEMYAQAGMQLGQAFAGAMEHAMQGGADSAEDVALDLMVSILTIAGGVIGAIAGEGDPYAAQAGSTIGHLAGVGIKSAVKSGDKKGNTTWRHDGGWIERFHGGGWPLGPDEQYAILQSGERVLSRREVSDMGGAAAVDSMARGGRGGGMHIHVSAIDTKSTREFFENDGGRGFYNALRTGRGILPVLLGGT